MNELARCERCNDIILYSGPCICKNWMVSAEGAEDGIGPQPCIIWNKSVRGAAEEFIRLYDDSRFLLRSYDTEPTKDAIVIVSDVSGECVYRFSVSGYEQIVYCAVDMPKEGMKDDKK